MSTQASFLRRVANALMAHAAAVLPAARTPWAEAMKHELQHVGSDLEAVTWAAGCVLASYVERSRVMNLLQSWYVRGFLALVILSQVLSFLFATVMTAAYRLNYWGVATFLGRFTPGDDYRRLIPVMDATPWWLHAMWVAASVLFLVSGWQLLRNRPAAFPLFATAWVLGAIGNWISSTLPASRAVFSYSEPLFTRDYLIPAVTTIVPLLVAAALWAHGRCDTAGEKTSGA